MKQIKPILSVGLLTGTMLSYPAMAILEETIVTAQKRAEDIQDVPISITTLDSESLENFGVKSVLDLNMVVPALNYTTTAGAVSPRIRGVGTAIATGGNENAVATYIDGVYYASAPASNLVLNNIAQVSVLKGPQGTLFGRNATGGLIQITTRDPSDEFSGEISGTYGNKDTYGAQLYLAGGLAPDLAADFALSYSDQDEGFGTNLANGEDVNKRRDLAVRSKWKLGIGENTTLTGILDYTKAEFAGPALRPVDGAPTPIGPFSGGEFDVNSNVQPDSSIKQYGASIDLRHDFETIQFVSISAYRHTDWDLRADTDGLPIDIVSLDIQQPDRQFSQEIQIISLDDSPLTWVLGAYYFDARGGFEPGNVGGVIADFYSTIDTRQETESLAGFGQATYAITEQTSLTAGLRYTNEKKTIDGSGSFSIPSANITIPRGPYSDSETEERWTWRLSVDHAINDQIMTYASYNRGFKSGGFDPTSTAVARWFKPEVLDAYEIGLKSELFDNKVRLNAALFYYDYQDIQLNTFENSLLVIYNGDDAEIYGLDFDLMVSPLDDLYITAGFSALHSEYGDFPITATEYTATGVIQLPDISAEGKKLQGTPDYTANLAVDYRVPLENGSSIGISASYAYTSRWYSTPENRLSQDPYSLVNASLAWYSDGDRYSIRLWGRNLGDEAYASQLSTQVPITDTNDIAPGRTFGITLAADF